MITGGSCPMMEIEQKTMTYDATVKSVQATTAEAVISDFGSNIANAVAINRVFRYGYGEKDVSDLIETKSFDSPTAGYK
ncbi:hypothetical protein HanIR_Chr15g0752611 [Helianthus annuus]|nr:hypothetical protein HanIR_Chr15g0752611 [Helianthus annuus]